MPGLAGVALPMYHLQQAQPQVRVAIVITLRQSCIKMTSISMDFTEFALYWVEIISHIVYNLST